MACNFSNLSFCSSHGHLFVGSIYHHPLLLPRDRHSPCPYSFCPSERGDNNCHSCNYGNRFHGKEGVEEESENLSHSVVVEGYCCCYDSHFHMREGVGERNKNNRPHGRNEIYSYFCRMKKVEEEGEEKKKGSRCCWCGDNHFRNRSLEGVEESMCFCSMNQLVA